MQKEKIYKKFEELDKAAAWVAAQSVSISSMRRGV